MSAPSPSITDVISSIPYRLALAGGWIDQPFISAHDPEPPGSMVVVSIEPDRHYMDRCGIATSTRKVAIARWGGRLPGGDPAVRVRELYQAENAGKAAPSGSQDMVGLIYPGISRLDYDIRVEGGVFPARIESTCDPAVAAWLEQVVNILPLCPRPAGYHPLGRRDLQPVWVRRLGQAGRDCYAAILARDVRGLGESLNEAMRCWDVLLPDCLAHPTLTVDLHAFLTHYRARYHGVMPSGVGGGYLYVISEVDVPGAFHPRVRLR